MSPSVVSMRPRSTSSTRLKITATPPPYSATNTVCETAGSPAERGRTPATTSARSRSGCPTPTGRGQDSDDRAVVRGRRAADRSVRDSRIPRRDAGARDRAAADRVRLRPCSACGCDLDDRRVRSCGRERWHDDHHHRRSGFNPMVTSFGVFFGDPTQASSGGLVPVVPGEERRSRWRRLALASVAAGGACSTGRFDHGAGLRYAVARGLSNQIDATYAGVPVVTGVATYDRQQDGRSPTRAARRSRSPATGSTTRSRR